MAITAAMGSAIGAIQLGRFRRGEPIDKAQFLEVAHDLGPDLFMYAGLLAADTSKRAGRFMVKAVAGLMVGSGAVAAGTAMHSALYERTELMRGNYTTSAMIGTGVAIFGNIANTAWVEWRTRKSNHPRDVAARIHARLDMFSSVPKALFGRLHSSIDAGVGYLAGTEDAANGLTMMKEGHISCGHPHEHDEAGHQHDLHEHHHDHEARPPAPEHIHKPETTGKRTGAAKALKQLMDREKTPEVKDRRQKKRKARIMMGGLALVGSLAAHATEQSSLWSDGIVWVTSQNPGSLQRICTTSNT